MKRPMLVSGAVTVIITALFLLFGQGALPTAAALGVSVLFLSLLLKKKFRRYYVLLFAGACVVFVSLFDILFYKALEKPAKAFSYNEHDVIAYVSALPEKASEDRYIYTFKTVRSDGEKYRISFSFECETKEYELYDTVAFYGADFSFFEGSLTEKAYTDKVFLTLSEYISSELLFEKSPTPYYYCLKLKDGCISNMKEYMTSSSAALLTGMTFGDKAELPLSLKNAFKACGVSHILAVSGLHVSLWCSVLLSVLKLFGASDKIKSILSLLFLLLLCTLSAFTPSVVRAALMSGLILIAPFFDRRADTVNSLGFAVTLILVSDPYLLLNPSFVLSALATAGVAFSSFVEKKIPKPILKSRLKRKLYDFFVSGTLVSISASVFTLPACAYFFKSFSIVAPLANLFVVTPSFYAMVTGMFLSLAAFIPVKALTSLLNVLFFVPEAIEKFISFAVRVIAKFPYASLPANTLTVAAVIISVGLTSAAIYVFFILHRGGKAIKITSCVFCAAICLISPFTNILPTQINRELTVISSYGYPVAVTRSGKDIALFGIPQSTESVSKVKSLLPTSKAQSFTYFFMMYVNVGYYDFRPYIHDYGPLNIAVSSDAFDKCAALCESTGAVYPKTLDAFSPGDKIYAEAIDTESLRCVIISSPKKRVTVSFSKFNSYSYVDTETDIAVIGEKEAMRFDGFCDTLIVCTYTGLSEEAREALLQNCNSLTVLSDGEGVTVNI